jgi:hypothetical protein
VKKWQQNDGDHNRQQETTNSSKNNKEEHQTRTSSWGEKDRKKVHSRGDRVENMFGF